MAIRLSRLMQYAPYFEVVGAALVFFSWLVSTSLSDRAAASEKNLNAATEIQRRHDRERLMWSWFRNADRQMTSIDQKLDEIRTSANSESGASLDHSYSQLQVLGIAEQELTDLLNFSTELKQAAGPIQGKLSDDATKLLDAVSKTNTAINELGSGFETARKRIAGKERFDPNKLSAAKQDELTVATDQFRKNVESALAPYLDYSNEAWRISAELVEHSTNSSKQAARTAEVAQLISYVLFAVGTGIAVLGKYWELRGKVDLPRQSTISGPPAATSESVTA